jgi:hypothetical protein
MLKILAKLKEFFTVKTENLLIISVVISLLAIVSAVTYHNYTSVKSMERNIESAIVKGIDPIAVKCAYENHSSNLCIAYATSPVSQKR